MEELSRVYNNYAPNKDEDLSSYKSKIYEDVDCDEIEVPSYVPANLVADYKNLSRVILFGNMVPYDL